MRRAILTAAAVALASAASAQQLVIDTTAIPQGAPHNTSSSENVDFGDLDGDGDWDAVFADGGDNGPDQNRIWINQGGLQGGTLGVFFDETALRLPLISERRAALQAGTLCLQPPLRRTIGVNSGGTLPPAMDCTGVYALDFNAFRAGLLGGSSALELFVPGTVVNAQWWGRDPGQPVPNNTTLSNAIEFTMCL